MMFRLTLKFGLHCVLRTDQRPKPRTSCIAVFVKLWLCQNKADC